MGQKPTFFNIMMNMENEIKKIIAEVLKEQPVDCLEIDIRGKGDSRVVSICLDKEDGITLDECAYYSRRISDRLDLEDSHLNLPAYRLEVSSPGIDRPLKTQADFKKNTGRVVKVIYNDADEIRSVEGKIGTADKDKVSIILKKDTAEISYAVINKATIQINWK